MTKEFKNKTAWYKCESCKKHSEGECTESKCCTAGLFEQYEPVQKEFEKLVKDKIDGLIGEDYVLESKSSRAVLRSVFIAIHNAAIDEAVKKLRNLPALILNKRVKVQKGMLPDDAMSDINIEICSLIDELEQLKKGGC